MVLRMTSRPVRTAKGLLHYAESSTSSSSPRTLPHRGLSSSDRLSSSENSGVLGKLKDAVKDVPRRSSEFEGVKRGGLRMLLFGKPGSGKGTLSARLVKEYDIAFVSTGDVLRKEIASKSEVGLRAEEVVARGELVSDELMLEIVKSELNRLKGKSWIMDGFPRTLDQGELLDGNLNQENRSLNMIVHLNVPDSVILDRIEARWVHLPSGRVYNTDYSKPKVEGKDDVTGEPLTKRPDDTAKVFSKRLRSYYNSTAPLLEYFSKAHPDSLHTLTGSTSDELWPQLKELVEPYGLDRRRPILSNGEVEGVRKDADDLTDPVEIEKAGVDKGKQEKAQTL